MQQYYTSPLPKINVSRGGGAVQDTPPGYIFTYYFPYWEFYPGGPPHPKFSKSYKFLYNLVEIPLKSISNTLEVTWHFLLVVLYGLGLLPIVTKLPIMHKNATKPLF